MKEVTICFSFSVKDGATKKFMDNLVIPNGLFGLGDHDIERLTNALKSEYLLLQQEPRRIDITFIKPHTLWVRLRVNSPDDLKTKNTTHAKSDIPHGANHDAL